MKKLSCVLFIAIMSVFLCACGDSNQVVVEREGIKCINYGKFGDVISERVELTTDNWKDYIKFYSYEEEIIEKDAFGEIVSNEKVVRYCLGAGNERYHQFQEALLELKNVETGELQIYSFEYGNECYVPEDFNLENYECTRVKGRLYFVDLPQEVLYSPLPALSYDWEYDAGFYIVSKGSVTPYRVNLYSKGIERNGSGSWDYFLEK